MTKKKRSKKHADLSPVRPGRARSDDLSPSQHRELIRQRALFVIRESRRKALAAKRRHGGKVAVLLPQLKMDSFFLLPSACNGRAGMRAAAAMPLHRCEVGASGGYGGGGGMQQLFTVLGCPQLPPQVMPRDFCRFGADCSRRGRCHFRHAAAEEEEAAKPLPLAPLAMPGAGADGGRGGAARGRRIRRRRRQQQQQQLLLPLQPQSWPVFAQSPSPPRPVMRSSSARLLQAGAAPYNYSGAAVSIGTGFGGTGFGGTGFGGTGFGGTGFGSTGFGGTGFGGTGFGGTGNAALPPQLAAPTRDRRRRQSRGLLLPPFHPKGNRMLSQHVVSPLRRPAPPAMGAPGPAAAAAAHWHRHHPRPPAKRALRYGIAKGGFVLVAPMKRLAGPSSPLPSSRRLVGMMGPLDSPTSVRV